jgi:hypothetical protein
MKPRGKLIVISCACLVCMCVCELHGRAAHVAATIPGLPPASPAVRPTTECVIVRCAVDVTDCVCPVAMATCEMKYCDASLGYLSVAE